MKDDAVFTGFPFRTELVVSVVAVTPPEVLLNILNSLLECILLPIAKAGRLLPD